MRAVRQKVDFKEKQTWATAFSQVFPGINFNTAGVTNATRPFTDIVTGAGGTFAGTLPAQGNDAQAGTAQLFNFSAVFTGTLNVPAPGPVTFTFTADDAFIFGVANGATSASGPQTATPVTTPFENYPVMGGVNQRSPVATSSITVNFPAAGAYPYEVDYAKGGDSNLTLSMQAGGLPIPAATLLTLSPSTGPSLTQGQILALNVAAMNNDGTAAENVPVTVNVTGPNAQSRPLNTGGSGQVEFAYAGNHYALGTDQIQATAVINGAAVYSNIVSQTWNAGVNQAPVVGAGFPQTITLPAQAILDGQVGDDGLPNNTLTITWSLQSGPAPVVFADPSQASTSVAFSVAGTYVLQLSAFDGALTTTSTVTITVNANPNWSAGWLANPLDRSTVMGQVPVTLVSGITLVSGSLTYYPANNPSASVTLNANTTGAGQIGTFDATLLTNGAYWVQLIATDSAGVTQTNLALVTVAGNYKPGRVTATITDFTVPAPGLPIQIQRTYDSLTRGTSLDFGFGWRLGVQVNLQVNPTGDVTFTINNQTRTFYFTPDSTIIPGFFVPAYTGEAGFYGSLSTTGDNCEGVLLAIGNIYQCGIDNAGAQYQALGFVYTDPYGRQYTISATGALQSVQDLNGNTITVAPTGITSSNGLNVPFVRDSRGRITQITDTLGNVYQYAYDANGNLSTVAFPSISTPTTYAYDPTHLLTNETDRRGNVVGTTTYYDDGQLQSVTDALGNITTYVYDVTNNKTTVSNPDGGTEVVTFDSYGKPISVQDPLGRTVTLSYDNDHNLTTATNPLGEARTYTYDSNGDITSVTDPLGNKYSATYGPNSARLSETDALGHTKNITYDGKYNPTALADSIGAIGTAAWTNTGLPSSIGLANVSTSTFSYDTYGNPTGVVDNGGLSEQRQFDQMGNWIGMTDAIHGGMTWSYDALSRTTGQTDPLGYSNAFTYDGNGNLVTETDKNGGLYRYTYDAANRRISTAFPDGTSRSTAFDYAGRPLTVTNENGVVSSMAYDLAGQLTSVTMAAGTADQSTMHYKYDLAGRLISIIDALGNTTTRTYDDAGRLIAVTDPLGQQTTYAFDGAGRATQITAPDGAQVLLGYDARNRMNQITQADGTVVALTFGPLQLQSSTDALGDMTQYAYDNYLDLQSVTDPDGNVFSYAWNPTGTLLSVTDPKSRITSFQYDRDDRRVRKTLPDGSFEQYGYDAEGNMTSMQLTDGHTNVFSYDARNRLTAIQYFDGSLVSFTYTPSGKRQSVTSSLGTAAYTYDAQDRITRFTQADGEVITYSYDPNGNILTRTTPAGTTQFAYDALNRISSVSDSTHGAVTLTYDPRGHVLQKSLPNGVVSNYSYDVLGRLIHVGHSAGAGAPFESFDYTFDSLGNRLQSTEANGAVTQWAYDALSRLIQETVVVPGGTGSRTTSLTYDAVGNIISRTDNGVTRAYQYNNLDQLLNDGVRSYSYDGRGNMASITDANGTASLTFDASNRLSSITMPGGGAAGYFYDGEGRLTSQNINGDAGALLWDPISTTGVPDIVTESSSPSNIIASYAFGPAGPLWSAGPNATAYYIEDGLRSTIGLTDQSGSETDVYRYDAYGQSTLHIGSSGNTFQYRGQWTDPLTGFQDLRARTYNPVTGSFLSRDTAEFNLKDPVDFNRYRYASSNPVNAFDPTGHNTITEYIVAQLPRTLSGSSRYVQARAEESFYAATLNAVGDFTVEEIGQFLVEGLETELWPLASKTLGNLLRWKITVSSARAIDRMEDEVAIGEAARGDSDGSIGTYVGADRKELAALSGSRLLTDTKNPRELPALLSGLRTLIDNAFPNSIAKTSLSESKAFVDAEIKVVNEAGEKWEILGIGASNFICIPCQRAIQGNSPAAIMVPIKSTLVCDQ